MTEDDLSWVESTLGVSLPIRYRNVMLVDPLDPGDFKSQIPLHNNRATVVAFNWEMREGEFASEWSADWLAIGSSPFGDTYYLDLTGESLEVFVWDHETHEVSSVAINLDRFMAAQREQAAEFRTQKDGPPSAPKPWWKFWRQATPPSVPHRSSTRNHNESLHGMVPSPRYLPGYLAGIALRRRQETERPVHCRR